MVNSPQSVVDDIADSALRLSSQRRSIVPPKSVAADIAGKRLAAPSLWVMLNGTLYRVTPFTEYCLVTRAFLPTSPQEWATHQRLSLRAYSFNDLKLFQVTRIQLAPTLKETDIKIWANACETSNRAIALELPPCPELPKHRAPLSWWIKTLCDRLAALMLLLVFSPVMIALALIVFCDSPGPILFQQWRIGENGTLFRIIKFRTMDRRAEARHHSIMGNQDGLHKCKNDPRVTTCGQWMRKYSLDELPQLLNVLRGEMSLVGPRPWALYDALRIRSTDRKRLNARPGITGAWQVERRSTLLDLDSVTACDLDYLSHWSLWRDLKLLLLTIPKVLTGFGAY